jgi:hypothetical protein
MNLLYEDYDEFARFISKLLFSPFQSAIDFPKQKAHPSLQLNPVQGNTIWYATSTI